jgi:hypothetical protein
MENLLPLVVFAVIVLISLVSKMRKKTDEESPSPPSETPELEDLPETLRRMLMGEPLVRKARPAAPKQGEETQPVIIVPPPRRDMPYQPPVARPAARPVQRPVAKPVVSPAADEEGPRRRPAGVVPQARTLVRVPQSVATRTPQVQVPRAPVAPQPVTGKKERMAASARRSEPHYELFKNLDDGRRGIILSELLGPPLSLR